MNPPKEHVITIIYYDKCLDIDQHDVNKLNVRLLAANIDKYGEAATWYLACHEISINTPIIANCFSILDDISNYVKVFNRHKNY